METRADQVRAIVYAIGLHLLILVVMLAGMFWTRSSTPVSVAGPAIEASLVMDPDALMLPVETPQPEPSAPPPAPQPEPEPAPPEPESAPPPQPEPEPRPQEAPQDPQPEPQEQAPDPAQVEQERIERIAREQAERDREQEEQRRQEQIDLTERQRQQEAEERERRAEQRREQERQLAEIRRQRAEAEDARRREEASLAALDKAAAAAAAEREAAASAAAPMPGTNGVDASLQARYALAIQQAIQRAWTRPETVPLGTRCRITIIQVPGGEVMSVDVDPSCPFDALGRRSVEAAVLRAAPLPYEGFESVFQRQLNLNFQAEDR